MRRFCLLVLLYALAVAGCGSSSTGSSSPVNSELSYFPAASPFVMSVVTDPNSAAVKNAHGLLARFPIASFGQTALMGRLDQAGIDYQSDVRPLLGNPIMLGTTGPRLSQSAGSSTFLAVWVTKDSSKLASLIKKVPGLHKVGSHNGATLYRSGAGTTFAVDGASLVLGASAAEVESALDRHAHGAGITSSQHARALTGLPEDALVQMFGNLSAALSQPSAVKARQVPWVAALRGYAASITANSAGLHFQYRLDTTGRALSSDQVPLPTATAAPGLTQSLPVAFGIQDPARLFDFVTAAERQTSPASYAKFLKRQAAARAKTGVDLNSLLKLATGSLIVAGDTHSTLGRVGVSDPAGAARTLAKLMTRPPAVLDSATSARRLGGGFYAIRQEGQTITVGIANKQIVAGEASPAKLRAFASAPTSTVPGAQGSVAFRIAVADLLHVALKQAPPEIAQTVLSSLGDITGWTAASPGAVTGAATLTIR